MTDPWLLDWNNKKDLEDSRPSVFKFISVPWSLVAHFLFFETNSLSSGTKWFPTSVSTIFFPSLTSCSLMVGATSSKFCPVLPFGKVTVRCRVHPRLINPCSCAAASWLRTLFSTCITTNNFCMKIIHIPDSVIVCFGILILRMCYHTTKKDFLHLPTAAAFRSISDCVTSISTICQQHILLSTVIIFPSISLF